MKATMLCYTRVPHSDPGPGKAPLNPRIATGILPIFYAYPPSENSIARFLSTLPGENLRRGRPRPDIAMINGFGGS